MSNRMYYPGDHEDSAISALQEGRHADAQVWALLALASAVNRLADVQEDS